MPKKPSRRDFMAAGASVLGAAVAGELAGIAWAGEKMVAQASAWERPKEKDMPHISVKLWPGRSEADKQRLADAIVKDVVEITGCSQASVSVSIEEVPPGDWKEQVYDREILKKQDFLYKKPGYSM